MNKVSKRVEKKVKDLICQIIGTTGKKWSEELYKEIGLDKAQTEEEVIQMLKDYLKGYNSVSYSEEDK